ncbi:MAG: flavin monoamine oxidase family protein [Planctomycetota bacterium]
MVIPRIGIIGGGPGGLMTAYCLQHAAAAPYQLTIMEASERLGGKVLTSRFGKCPVTYEAGAAEFYDYSPVGEDPLKELIGELGLSIRSMEGGGLLYQGRLLERLEEIGESLGDDCARGLRDFDRLARDLMTPKEFYEDDPRWAQDKGGPRERFGGWLAKNAPPEVRKLLENLIHSDLATEPQQTGLGYGLQNYLMNHPAYMRLYSIEGGNDQLVQELARRIEAKIQLRHRVLGIDVNDEGNFVVSPRATCSSQHATAGDDVFDYLVLALPSGSLGSLRLGPPPLAEALSAHLRRFHHPAHYLRITLLFSRPFWRELLRDSFCMLEAMGDCCLYDESTRSPGVEQGILGWLLGGEAAIQHSELSDQALIELALGSLPQSLSAGRQLLLEGRVHRWIGEVSAWPGGVPSLPLDARHQPCQERFPGLFVVGDYLFDSTLNGVLDSASYVAEWLASEINSLPAQTSRASSRNPVS